MFNPPTAVVPGLLRRLRVSNHGEAQKRDSVGGAALALLVDPDDANATRMGRLLNGLGFEVTRMRSGCAALGDLHLLAPRVAVVTDDVNDLPADQLVRHLQAITQTPILLLTEQPANEATAPRLGTNATLEKTASDAAVRGALEALLARSGSSPKPPLSAADFDRAQFFRVYSGLFHRSPQMREVERTALQMS